MAYPSVCTNALQRFAISRSGERIGAVASRRAVVVEAVARSSTRVSERHRVRAIV
jgi:hypothetical protein